MRQETRSPRALAQSAGKPAPAPDAGLHGDLAGRFETGDLLAFLYALVLVRQTLWLLSSTAAWVLSFGAAALLAVLRIQSRPRRQALPRPFWLGVVLPIVAFWALHLPYPDVAWDTLNYHLMHGERAIRGLIAIPGDFYPYYFPFLNPAPDMLAALFRHLLGYRLGTIGSCLVLLWTGAVLFRALERAIPSTRWRAAATLWVLATEGILWEVGNYMADLWALPLLLEAVFLVLPASDEDRESDPLAELPMLALLLGTSVALKLTNLVFAAAIGAVWIWRFARTRWRGRDLPRTAVRLALAGALFFVPMAPHVILLWWTTGSPVFPHYNAFFRSPLFPAFDVFDGRFGPHGALETLVWPFVATLHPTRFTELGVASGRLVLGYVAALAALLFSRGDRALRSLAVVFLLGALLWSLGTGYQRYDLPLDLVGGVLVVLLAARALAALDGSRMLRFWSPFVIALLAVQTLLVLALVDRADWSGRPLGFRSHRYVPGELRRLGRDRELSRELPGEARRLVSSFGGWVDAVPLTNGVMALLAPSLPMIDLKLDPFFDIPANLPRFDEALAAVEGKTLGSLASSEDVAAARVTLAKRGFIVRGEQPLEIPFFSDRSRFEYVLFSVEPPPPRPGTARLSARQLLLRRPPSTPGEWIQDDNLLGSVDDPAEGATVSGDLLVRGWARGPDQDFEVTILFDGVPRAPASFRRTRRPDVAAVFPQLGSVESAGYEATFGFTPADSGPHSLVAMFRSRDGRLRLYPPRRFVWTAARDASANTAEGGHR